MSEWISIKDALPPEGVEVLTVELRLDGTWSYLVDYVFDYQDGLELPLLWARRREEDWDRVTHWKLLESPHE